MNATERFELMAELFCKETGHMAPGKDSPAAFGVTDKEEAMTAWKEWVEVFYSNLFDTLVGPTVKDMQDELDLVDELHFDELVECRANVMKANKGIN